MRDDELRERFRGLADQVTGGMEQPAPASIRARGRRVRRRATATALLTVLLLAAGGTVLVREVVLTVPQEVLGGDGAPTTRAPAVRSPAPVTAGPPPTPTPAPPPPTRPPSTTTTRPTGSTAEPPTAAPPRPASPPAPCQTRALVAANRGTSAAAGSIGLTVGLRNTGSAPCTLTGSPALVLLRDGTELPTNAVPDSGDRAGPVTLRPGAEVRFTVLWTNPGMEPDPDACQPQATHLRISPPRAGGSLTIAASVNACDGDLRVTDLAP